MRPQRMPLLLSRMVRLGLLVALSGKGWSM